MKTVPFLNLDYQHNDVREDIFKKFQDVYNNNMFILGENLEKFETNYAKFSESKYAIGVGNGLGAIFLSLKALGIGREDEVIVPSFTFIATVLAVYYTGATPVFVEPDKQTCNITAVAIEQCITPRTKAIIPVHLYGQSCSMTDIMNIAHQYNIFVIEDNAQAHGATFEGKITGSWGDINATSFYPGKNLGALGDGGVVTTNSDELERKIKLLRNYGSIVKYEHEVIGYNLRLDELQAAFLDIKLKKLKEWTKKRQEIAALYNEFLKDLGDLVLPYVQTNATHVYHLYVIKSKRRDDLQKKLKKNGIGCLIHYPTPPHLQKAFSYLNFKQGDFPIAEELSNTVLSLPIWPGLGVTEVEKVCDIIKNFFQGK